MATIVVSLDPDLKAFVDGQVEQRGFATSGEYVRELIQRDRNRTVIRQHLLAGVASRPGPAADDAYFAALRGRAHGHGDV